MLLLDVLLDRILRRRLGLGVLEDLIQGVVGVGVQN